MTMIVDSRSKSEKQKETDVWIEKDGSKPASRLDFQVEEAF